MTNEEARREIEGVYFEYDGHWSTTPEEDRRKQANFTYLYIQELTRRDLTQQDFEEIVAGHEYEMEFWDLYRDEYPDMPQRSRWDVRSHWKLREAD